jgi:hypothetical protein
VCPCFFATSPARPAPSLKGVRAPSDLPVASPCARGGVYNESSQKVHASCTTATGSSAARTCHSLPHVIRVIHHCQRRPAGGHGASCPVRAAALAAARGVRRRTWVRMWVGWTRRGSAHPGGSAHAGEVHTPPPTALRRRSSGGTLRGLARGTRDAACPGDGDAGRGMPWRRAFGWCLRACMQGCMVMCMGRGACMVPACVCAACVLRACVRACRWCTCGCGVCVCVRVECVRVSACMCCAWPQHDGSFYNVSPLSPPFSGAHTARPVLGSCPLPAAPS